MLQFLKRSSFTLLLLGMVLHLSAQDQQYFVYIQSERSQPFYVRYDGKLIPSSDRGYLILSKMPEGTASLRIGFAKSDAPERQYLVRITGPADQGYLLKQDGDRGYALFNLQTFAVIRPGEDKMKEAVAAAETPAPDTAPVQETLPASETATAAATTTLPVSADTAPVPAPPVAAGGADDEKQTMMAALKKDLDSTFSANSGATVGPGTRPVKKTNKFSQALDKVVSDDRPDDIELEQPQAPVAVAPATGSPAVVAAVPETPKKKRRRREREPLTDEEKVMASAVLAEENKVAPPDVAPAQDKPAAETEQPVSAPAPEVAAPQPVAESVPAQVEPAKEDAPLSRKERKLRKKKVEDPAFIDFVDTGGHQAPPAGSVVAPATEAAAAPVTGDVTVAAPVEETEKPKKKKRNKLAEKLDTVDMSEHPNNVVNDSTGYAVSDLSIDHPKESKKDRKKKKDAVVEAPVVTEPVAEPVADSKNGSLKMINSDCGKVMDDDTFRKMLRKFVAGKDDDGMIDAFRKQTKGYCLESSQIRTLVQLLGTDESKYRLLDLAYPKAYHSDEYAALEGLLSDSYYKGRFKAMLHK